MIRRLSYDDVDTLRRRITALEMSLKATQQAARTPNRRRTPSALAPAPAISPRVGNDHLTQGIVARTRLPRAGLLDIERERPHDSSRSYPFGYSRVTVRIAGAILLVDRSVAFARFATDLVI